MPGSLSQRIILCCILPLLAISALYSAYTIYGANKKVAAHISSVGNIISTSLMDTGAKALVSNSSNRISQETVASILNRQDIVAIEWLTLKRKRFLIIADEQLQIHTDNNEKAILKNYAVSEYLIYHASPTQKTLADSHLTKPRPAISKAAMPELRGYIKIYFDKHYLLNNTYHTLLLELGVMLIILLLTIGATTISVYYLSKRLRRIFKFITQLDNGNYANCLEVEKRDELGSLSRRLNQLSLTLSQNQRDIKDERERLNSAIVEQTRLRNEADKANSWLKQTLGILSHEMRTPLNAVVGPIDMLLTKANNPFMTRRLENAQSHINDMLAQLDNLMDYTQLEYGQQALSKTPTNIRDTIDRVISNYQLMAEQKGLALSSHYNGDLAVIEHYYNIDGQRLTQILINLVSNAIKFSHSGNITVYWSLTPLVLNDALVTIDVKDQGIGVPADMSKDIFTMFQQADTNISRQYGGLGIGLGLCKKYADLFGGQLSMRSQKNVGSTFTFTFSAEKILLPVNEHPITTDTNYYYKKRINVLIVEDNIENCNVLCQLLQRIAPNISLATERDGKNALKRIMQNDFNIDIAFVDIHLPKVPGLEIIKNIRHYYPDTRIIAVTADTSFTNQDACFEAGAQQFIKKPVRLINIAQVFEKIEQYSQ